MTKRLSRRRFLKLSGAVPLGLTFSASVPATPIDPIGGGYPDTTSYPVLFCDDFEDTAATEARWNPRSNYSFATGRTGQGICIESISGTDVMITTPISVEDVKGGALALAASIKAENVSQPPNPWNGIKVMLKIVLSDGEPIWPQVDVGTGTFDWTSLAVLISVPATAVSAVLHLGIEQCSGTVWFDDVLIKLMKDPADFPPPRDPNIPIDKCHDLSALRGAMVSNWIGQNDGQVLGQEWRANLVRWQLGGCAYPEGLQTPGYDAILEEELIRLDHALFWCRQYGLMVVVDLHSLSQGCFRSADAQNKLVNVWQAIAARYRNSTVVWAYDLVNEPDPRGGAWSDDGVLIWEDLADRIVREVRLIDANKPIIIESLYAAPWAFSDLRPLDFAIPRIIYSAHMYEPHAFTHQTVLPEYSQPCVYPGTIDETVWNKSQLVNALAPVKDFQDKYRVPVFVGEFSAIRWAPSNSAFYYLKDCIEVFESCGWDWCYHAFREWDGWSVEHSEDQNDPNPTPTPNERQLLLRSYFGQNINPYARYKDYLPFIAR